MTEIYISTDIEADGPIPGPYSMLSFSSAAFGIDKTLISTFTANLETLPGASTHPETMKFWNQHPEAWEACRTELQPPEKAMKNYSAWLKSLPGTPIFVGYPVTYDFLFVYWYLLYFVGESPFEYRGLDIRTYAMAVLKRKYITSGKAEMPKRWFDEVHHTHVSLDDAIEQGRLFCNMLAENISRRSN